MLQSIEEMERANPDRFVSVVVQVMHGEPINAIGPFSSREEATDWIRQHRETQPETDKAAFFVTTMVLP